MNLEKLVEVFARNTAAQNDAIWRGDAKMANKHAKKVNATFDKLCAHGNLGRDALTVLFTHPRLDVRVRALVCIGPAQEITPSGWPGWDLP